MLSVQVTWTKSVAAAPGRTQKVTLSYQQGITEYGGRLRAHGKQGPHLPSGVKNRGCFREEAREIRHERRARNRGRKGEAQGLGHEGVRLIANCWLRQPNGA